jgi:hypothetical protein
MDGFLDLPLNKSQAKTYIFTADYTNIGAFASQGMQKWVKPKGINFIYGLLIGAGSGGGGGGLNGGGGGGAPGNYVTFIQPAIAIPDELWVTVAFGGIGGNGGNPNGSAGAAPAGLGAGAPVTGLWWDARGTNSTVNSAPAYGGTFYTYITNGGASSGGTSVGGGSGGSAAGAGTGITQAGVNGFSVLTNGPGTATGFAGGFTTAGTNAPFLGRPQGGAGGGGRSGGAQSGGTVVQPSGGPFANIGKRFGGDPGGNGEDGITLFSPTLFITPGAGGGANDSGVGGVGGKGGIGCGGGGGGAGSSGGGNGGDGGDGLIMLVCW